MVCTAYERSLKEELQSGYREFSISNILNDGPNAGKQMNAIMRFIRIRLFKYKIGIT